MCLAVRLWHMRRAEGTSKEALKVALAQFPRELPVILQAHLQQAISHVGVQASERSGRVSYCLRQDFILHRKPRRCRYREQARLFIRRRTFRHC